MLNDRIRVLLEEGSVDKCSKLISSAVVLLQKPGTDKSWLMLLDTVISQKLVPNTEKTKMLQTVLAAAAGFSNPSAILNFLLKHPAYSGATFGDLRPLFTGKILVHPIIREF